MRTPAKPPFSAWAAHYHAPDIGYAWYIEAKALFICHTTVAKASGAGAARLCDWMDQCLEEDAENILSQGGIAILHDWRSLESYDAEARQTMVERIKRRRKGYARQTTVVVQGSPLMKMGMQVANVALAVTGNSSLRMFHDIAEAMPSLRGVEPGRRPSWLG